MTKQAPRKDDNDFIIIPELEEAMKTYTPAWKPYTKKDELIIKRYFGKVDLKLLAKQLGRTPEALNTKAGHLGLTGKGKE